MTALVVEEFDSDLAWVGPSYTEGRAPEVAPVGAIWKSNSNAQSISSVSGGFFRPNLYDQVRIYIDNTAANLVLTPVEYIVFGVRKSEFFAEYATGYEFQFHAWGVNTTPPNVSEVGIDWSGTTGTSYSYCSFYTGDDPYETHDSANAPLKDISTSVTSQIVIDFRAGCKITLDDVTKFEATRAISSASLEDFYVQLNSRIILDYVYINEMPSVGPTPPPPPFWTDYVKTRET